MSSLEYSIVVPTFRRPQALRQTVEALLGLQAADASYEIVIVDDAGPDGGAIAVVEDLDHPQVPVRVETQDRGGAAAARNRGARAATGELLLFVDDDIVVPPDHLLAHRAARAAHPDALVNGRWEFTVAVLQELAASAFGRFRVELERQFAVQAMGRDLGDGCIEMALLGTWDLAVERSVFWELGGFDEEFPVAGAEDQDFSLRARAAGHRLLLDPRIRCLHNDNRLTLRAYCEREERSASTMPFLARKYPEQFGHAPYVRENRPISRADPPRLALKKAAKAMLATPTMLECLHRLTSLLERSSFPEAQLRRLYPVLLGLHLYRGFRSTWS